MSKQIIYCNDFDCLHYQSLKEDHFIKFHIDHTPWEDTGFKGICTREEVGIEPKIITTQIAVYKTMICKTRSDKKIGGHVDFSKRQPVLLKDEQIDEYNRDKDKMQFNIPFELSKRESNE